MTLTTVNRDFANNAPGQLFLFAYPTADPGGTTSPTNTTRLAGLLALLYDTDTAYKTLKSGVSPWGDIDENGLQFKVKTTQLAFPRNDGSVPARKQSGIEEATATLDIYDADAAHWADCFGLASADLLTIAAASGHAGRQSALLGFPDSSAYYVAILRMRSATTGEYDHLILPRVNFLVEPDIKYSQKDKIQLKAVLNCNGDKYILDSHGIPVFAIPSTVNAAATS